MPEGKKQKKKVGVPLKNLYTSLNKGDILMFLHNIANASIISCNTLHFFYELFCSHLIKIFTKLFFPKYMFQRNL
jgi:hypothetical protein